MPTPVADALMAAVLADPTDPLRRLVFADFLDDTGTPGNAAWAEYLRLRTAAADESSPVKRELLRESAGEAAGRITARLTLSAGVFLNDVSSFLELLPAARYTVTLAGFTPPRILPDADRCRRLRGLPLRTGAGLAVAGVIEAATLEHFEQWRLGYGFDVLVRVPTPDLEPAIQRVYTSRALALVMPRVTAEPVPTTLDEQLGTASAEAVRVWVEQRVVEARERGASAIDITAYQTHHWVRRVEGGRALRWHKVGTALGQELVRAARVLPARRLHVRVRPRNSSFGEGVRIALLNPPAPAGVPAPLR